MITDVLEIDFPTEMPAWTMSGRLVSHSTKKLHSHNYHQVLIISKGVTLLVDSLRTQPLYGAMAALIPAEFPHRSVVIGEPVEYKSLYLKTEIFDPDQTEITIFEPCELSKALFYRIHLLKKEDITSDLNLECLDLLLKILRVDRPPPSTLVRLPEPRWIQNRKIIEFIEKNYAYPLKMEDFGKTFFYSERQLSRVFKADLKISIIEYLRLYRLLMASILLCNVDTSISNIAYNVGYESISSFYRDFNLVFAITPKNFRERNVSRPK